LLGARLGVAGLSVHHVRDLVTSNRASTDPDARTGARAEPHRWIGPEEPVSVNEAHQ
jgi:hypothetical protein